MDPGLHTFMGVNRIIAGLLLALSVTLVSCGAGGDQDGMGHGSMRHPDENGGHMSEMDGHHMADAARKMTMPNGKYSDKAFIDAMIPHHQSAIEMAEIALKKADHQKIKTLAGNIISSQRAEIQELREIRKRRFGSAKPRMSMSRMDMRAMDMFDSDRLSKARPFDEAFIDAMIPHHRSAIVMAKIARQKTNDPEIRRIADGMVSAQKHEIDQMIHWRIEWYPGG